RDPAAHRTLSAFAIGDELQKSAPGRTRAPGRTCTSAAPGERAAYESHRCIHSCVGPAHAVLRRGRDWAVRGFADAPVLVAAGVEAHARSRHALDLAPRNRGFHAGPRAVADLRHCTRRLAADLLRARCTHSSVSSSTL